MTPERERFAEALAIQSLYSSGGPRWIAERIGALAAAGDLAGVKRFKAIAAAYEQLLHGTIQ